MNFYKDNEAGEVFAFESDGSQDSYISKALIPMTEYEVMAHLNPPLTAEQALAEQYAKLHALIVESDATKAVLSSRISVLKDAFDLGMETISEVSEKLACEEQLVEWKRYGVLLGRVTSQVDFPAIVDWPLKPTQG